ncbi:MAG: hypothetical protein H0W15_02075 [Gemmatimonadales bacterium]|nr:hypothetical protein [Gemmatimonadales bacterium]
MFVGHAGLAFAARARYRDVPLGTLMAAAFALDLIWPLLVLAGLETVTVDPAVVGFTPLVFTWYPWSHSLLMVVGWGVVAALIVRARGHRREVGMLVALLVVSHWVLDVVVHHPDLPFWPGAGTALAGLGLWNSVPGTLAVEGLLFAGGVAMYWRRTVARSWQGASGFWALVIVMGILWASAPLLPPPASGRAVALGALSLWLIPFWAAWCDSHRDRAPGGQIPADQARGSA